VKKDFRVRVRSDFLRACGSGFYFKKNAILVQCAPNGLSTFRVGFTASKKVGNAVIRNRSKRRMRAVADLVLPEIGLAGVDYIFIARRSMPCVEWNLLLESVIEAVRFLNNKIQRCKKF
jgi:ribonuclease P protein component